HHELRRLLADPLGIVESLALHGCLQDARDCTAKTLNRSNGEWSGGLRVASTQGFGICRDMHRRRKAALTVANKAGRSGRIWLVVRQPPPLNGTDFPCANIPPSPSPGRRFAATRDGNSSGGRPNPRQSMMSS